VRSLINWPSYLLAYLLIAVSGSAAGVWVGTATTATRGRLRWRHRASTRNWWILMRWWAGVVEQHLLRWTTREGMIIYLHYAKPTVWRQRPADLLTYHQRQIGHEKYNSCIILYTSVELIICSLCPPLIRSLILVGNFYINSLLYIVKYKCKKTNNNSQQACW